MRKTYIKQLVIGGLAINLFACGKEDDTGKKKPSTTVPAPSGSDAPADTAPVAGSCFRQPETTLRLVEDEALTLDRAAVERKLAQLTPSGFDVRITNAYRNAAGGDASHFDLVQEFGGIPLCGYRPRASVVHGDVSLPIIASYKAPESISDAAFGTPEAALALGAASIGAHAGTAEVRQAERCLAPSAGELVPAFDILASIADEPYRLIANSSELLSIEAQSMHATQAKATIFKRNPKEAAPVDMLIDVGGDGSLNIPNLRVVTTSGAVAGPKAVNGKLAPAAGTPAFLEVTVFAHAAEQLAYNLQFRTIGEADCMPIEIEAHAASGPVYRPSWNQKATADSPGGHPRILVPDEVPGTLKNLALDYDAVAHEMGHHFVYQRLKSLSYAPSLVIHEGLADFFVFAHTGDTCLAESICPEDTDSALCVVHGQCLREGDVAKSGMRFYTKDYNAAPYHKRSQALSGMLVDLGKDPAIGSAAIAKVMYAGIDFLKEKSEIGDWLEAVLQGDKAVFAGAHACAIVAKAKEFGLTEETAAMDCKTYVTK